MYDATIGGKAFYEEIWHPVTATGCQFWYRDRLRLPPAFILASGDLLTIKALLAPSTAPAVPASPALATAVHSTDRPNQAVVPTLATED